VSVFRRASKFNLLIDEVSGALSLASLCVLVVGGGYVCGARGLGMRRPAELLASHSSSSMALSLEPLPEVK